LIGRNVEKSSHEVVSAEGSGEIPVLPMNLTAAEAPDAIREII